TALVIALQARGSGGFTVAALLVAAAAPPTLLAPLTGRLADRVDSRRLLFSVSLAQAALCTALAFVGQTALLVALVALLGCGLAAAVRRHRCRPARPPRSAGRCAGIRCCARSRSWWPPW